MTDTPEDWVLIDDDKALVERLRWGGWYFDNPYDGNAYASDDPLYAADRIEAQAAEIERLRKENDIRQGRIERLEKLHRDIISYQAGKAEQ
jgi:hypothetical protein